MRAKRIILFITIIFVSFAIFLIWGAADYIKFINVVKSQGAMPWQDGGTITLVRQPCVLDTPSPPLTPTTCAVSCPLVTSVWATACTGYIEIDTVGQLGTTFIAAPIGFVYQGGGTMPQAGMQFLAGGASNGIPWVIGIPGVMATRFEKIKQAFDFIIAGFKKE